uniref:Uncharacterized protein n=1 Tax=Panagrolaimus sp. PS1159 TaxID=55785 RepID=A0AC35GLJ5_9BILA
MNLVWFLLAIIFQICLAWISLFACKKKGLKKKTIGKTAKTDATTKDDEENPDDSDEEKKGKKKKNETKGKAKNVTAKNVKKGKAKKGETEITEDPDLRSRDDYGINTKDESMRHLTKK